MRTAAQSAKARIDRILKRFSDPATPELASFVSGVNENDIGSIDDGSSYGDPHKDTRPDFVQKDSVGWHVLRKL